MRTAQVVRTCGTILQTIDPNFQKHIFGEIIVVGCTRYSQLVILMVLALAVGVAGFYLASIGNCPGHFYCAGPLYIWPSEQ